MPVSIGDVAQRAGVSAGTVSHVLNGSTRVHISASTKDRVRRAAADLGYVPNRIARGLGRSRTETIGLFLPSLQNPFYVQLLERIEMLAMDRGYHVLLDAVHNIQPRTKLRGWPIDGVLMWGEPLQNLHQHLESQADEMPLVYMGGQARTDDSDLVYFDVYSGIRKAMRHLLERNHRRIAYLFPFEWVTRQMTEPRHCAYRDVCHEAGIPTQMMLMREQFESRHAGLVAGLDLAAMPLDKRPTAVLAFNDVVAQGVIFGLRRGGLRVPDDVAVIGVDGLEEGQDLDVPLTTVVLPRDEMCREALSRLLQRMKSKEDCPSNKHVVPTHLRIGGTT